MNKFCERRQSVSSSATSPAIGEPKQSVDLEIESIQYNRWSLASAYGTFLQIQAQKKARLDEKFETFVDHSPTFPKDDCKIVLPGNLSGIELKWVNRMLQSENQALFKARFFRDRCESLEQKICQLQTEKEGVRYFWRRILGQLLKPAISASENK